MIMINLLNHILLVIHRWNNIEINFIDIPFSDARWFRLLIVNELLVWITKLMYPTIFITLFAITIATAITIIHAPWRTTNIHFILEPWTKRPPISSVFYVNMVLISPENWHAFIVLNIMRVRISGYLFNVFASNNIIPKIIMSNILK
jgi:hypothetical protein